jgi:hypothetical protein
LILPIVIGDLHVEITSEDAIGDITYEFYVNDVLKDKKTTIDTTVEFEWDNKAFLIYTIKVIVIDSEKNIGEDSVELLILNLT